MKVKFFERFLCCMMAVFIFMMAVPMPVWAAAMKMNTSVKTLYLNEDNMTETSDSYDFSIVNKPANYQSKYTFAWSVEDDTIIKVETGGVVTALKVGQTTVYCDINSKSTGELFIKASATVTVKANASSVTIDNAPENNQMTAGNTFTFNRTMTAINGGEATDKTEWFVYADETGTTLSEIASIDENGMLTATKTGTVFVVAKTYQSAATKDLGYTATSAPVEVEILNTILSLLLTKPNQLTVTFAAPVDYKATTYVVTDTISSSRVYSRAVTYSDDKRTAKLGLHDSLTNGQTYKLAVDGMSRNVDVVIGKPQVILLNQQTISANTKASIAYNVMDENGVDITADTPVTMESTAGIVDGTTLQLADGETADVTIVYTDPESSDAIRSPTVSVMATSNSSAELTGFAIGQDYTEELSWRVNIFDIYVGDLDKTLFVRGVDPDGNDVIQNFVANAALSFEGLSPEIIEVDARTGKLVPLNKGTGYVRITVGTKRHTITISVIDAARDATFALSTRNGSLTNAATGASHQKNWAGITVSVLDQYGRESLSESDITMQQVSGTGQVAYNGVTIALNEPLTVKSRFIPLQPIAAGQVVFSVSYGSLGSRTTSFNITENDTVAVDYGIVGLAEIAEMDLHKVWNDAAADKVYAELALYSKNSKGEYIDFFASDGVDNRIEVKKDSSNVSIPLEDGKYPITAEIIKGLSVGTYTVEAYHAGELRASGSFTVKDTATAPVATLKAASISREAINLQAFRKLLTIPYNYTLTGLRFTSSNPAVLESVNSFATEAPFLSYGSDTVVLSDIVIQLENKSNGREYQVSFENSVDVNPPAALAAPDAPIVTSQLDNQNVTISWNAPKNNGSVITQYQLYQNGTLMETFTADKTSHTINGLTRGEQYNFKLTATNAIGTSADSNTVTVTIPAIQLSTPAHLAWSGKSATWDAVENAARYSIVLTNQDIENDAEASTTVESSTTSYDFQDAIIATGHYVFRVAAIGDGKTYSDSASSPDSGVYAYTAPAVQLPTPTNLAWSAKSATWDAVDNAESYTVALYKDGAAVAGTFGTADLFYDFTAAMTASGTYTFRVTAVGDGISYANSDFTTDSAGYVYTAPAVQLPTPTNLAWSAKSATWEGVDNAVKYAVTLYKDGAAVGNAVETTALSYDFTAAMTASGTYTFRVTAVGDGISYANSDSTTDSAEYAYTAPVQLSTPTNLAWTGKSATWEGVDNAVKYAVELFKDGAAVGNAVETAAHSYDFTAAMTASGTYTFRVTAVGNGTSYTNSDSTTDSAGYVYTAPPVQLSTPANLAWSAKSATWDAVDNAVKYAVTLYKDGAAVGNAVETTALSYDFTAAMTASGTYTFRVTAVGNGTSYTNSAASNASTTYTLQPALVTFTSSSSATSTSFAVKNNTGNQLDSMLIVAAYDANGVLITSTIQKAMLDANGTADVSVLYKTTDGIASVSVYVLNPNTKSPVGSMVLQDDES